MTPYEILGVKPECSDEELKIAYRKACMRTHPDRGGDPQEFDRIQKAYQTLMRRPCHVCQGKGWVSRREGAFVRRFQCPECWKKD